MKRLIKPTFNLFPFDASHFDQKIYFMWRWTDINIEFGIFIPLMVFKIHSLWQFNGQTIIIFAIILVTNLVFWRITTSYFVQIFRNKIFRSKKKKKMKISTSFRKLLPQKWYIESAIYFQRRQCFTEWWRSPSKASTLEEFLVNDHLVAPFERL